MEKERFSREFNGSRTGGVADTNIGENEKKNDEEEEESDDAETDDDDDQNDDQNDQNKDEEFELFSRRGRGEREGRERRRARDEFLGSVNSSTELE